MVLSWKYKSRVFRYIKKEQLPEVVDILHNPEAEKYLWFAPITLEVFRAYCLPIIEDIAALPKDAVQEMC